MKSRMIPVLCILCLLYTSRSFAGVEHRIEFVREKDGVKYYNDSIASSPSRTCLLYTSRCV